MPTKLPDFIAFDEIRMKPGRVIAGIDEAGRGPLAGPVVAACARVLRTDFSVRIDDSKKLSEKQREAAFQEILCKCEISFAFIEPERIDDVNILRATFEAMSQAYAGMQSEIDLVLVDGTQEVPLPVACEFVPKGDAKSLSIACASIVAKVTRDRLMNLQHERYPVYGFDRHKGYGTAQHLKSLKDHGPCTIHRKSFSPVQENMSCHKSPVNGN